MKISRALRAFLLVYEAFLVVFLGIVGIALYLQDVSVETFRNTLGLAFVLAGIAWLLLALFLGGSSRGVADISTRTLYMAVPGKPPFVYEFDKPDAVRKRRIEVLSRLDESIIAGVTGLSLLGLAALVAVSLWAALGVLVGELAGFAALLAVSRGAIPSGPPE